MMYKFRMLCKSWIFSMIASLFVVLTSMSHALAASNVATIESAVASFKTIGTLRREFPINGEAIAAAYTGALQTLTKEIDTAIP